jgi:putative ATP-dependent endonuclease of the OLD family
VATAGANQKPFICRLTIENFRGIEKLEWTPNPGVNVILGGGDVGKTTILDAIALLLSPANTMVLSDADYWGREIEKGFCIEAVMSLPDSCGINQQNKNAWPWEWNGKEPQLPRIDGGSGNSIGADPVYRLRVRGTEEFDLAFEILQPDDTVDHFSVAVRRKIGIVRLGGDDRNDRDLRLVQGSALERLLADKTLRSRVGQKLAKGDVKEELKEEAKQKLLKLDESFKEQKLPGGLSLGLTGSQGLSLNSLIGLTASKNNVQLPLASWGAGTRRLAALEIAAADQTDNPITLVDEVERGLEPYRQRVLMAELQQAGSQVFLTTHSAIALHSASDASFWYLDAQGAIDRLPAPINSHLKDDPEAFLSRITIVAEGKTEIGFVRYLLEQAIGRDLLSLGVWITDGGGNEKTLQLLEGLTKSGLQFSGFADNEGTFPNKWASIQQKLGRLLFRWPNGRIEENIIKLIPDEQLEKFIRDPDGESGMRLRTLADRLGIEGEKKEFGIIKATASDLKKLIIEASSGIVPGDTSQDRKKEFRKHAERWFKSEEGGRELAVKVFEFGLWPQLISQLLPFLTAIREVVVPAESTEPPS